MGVSGSIKEGKQPLIVQSGREKLLAEDVLTYFRHPLAVFALQALFGLLKVCVFAVVARRLQVPVHGVWRAGSHRWHYRDAKRGGGEEEDVRMSQQKNAQVTE